MPPTLTAALELGWIKHNVSSFSLYINIVHIGWKWSQLVLPVQAMASPISKQPSKHSGETGKLKYYMEDTIIKQNVSNLAEAQANVLGGEVAMWTEQADGDSIMTKWGYQWKLYLIIIALLRIEPRASAYAERLWRGPLTSSNWVEAERRLVIHRERIARRGVTADSMTHGWCRYLDPPH